MNNKKNNNKENNDNDINQMLMINNILIYSQISSVISLYNKLITEGSEVLTKEEIKGLTDLFMNVVKNINDMSQELEKWNNELQRRKGQ